MELHAFHEPEIFSLSICNKNVPEIACQWQHNLMFPHKNSMLGN